MSSGPRPGVQGGDADGPRGGHVHQPPPDVNVAGRSSDAPDLQAPRLPLH